METQGQMTLFPEEPKKEPAKKEFAEPAVLELPSKATCTSFEAARCLGVTERQVRNWVCDGTLLAINSSRDPVRPRKEKRIGQLNRWRVVVRRSADLPRESPDKFLTLQEFLALATNKANPD